jgi:hypothetical protein
MKNTIESNQFSALDASELIAVEGGIAMTEYLIILAIVAFAAVR